METWEVFRRHGHKQAFEHVGTVTAPDPEMALLLAKECFVRRREGEHLWIVNRADIHSFKDETLLEISADKSYRFPEAYRDVVVLRERARQRAEQLSGEEATNTRDVG
jgi:ring-1,2-phenylacetyl-CoA epoxidase subunit PaaB